MKEPIQFYTDEETKNSFNVLQNISHILNYNFVIIGGWAVYNYTKKQKSKDIDIIINPQTYENLKNRNYIFKQIGNTDILYTKISNVEVDIFVTNLVTDLPIIINDIILSSTRGLFNNIYSNKNLLLILKTFSYFTRKTENIKKAKDIIDVVSLLFFGNINFNFIRKYKGYKNITYKDIEYILLHYILPRGLAYKEHLGIFSDNEYYKYWDKVKKEIKI